MADGLFLMQRYLGSDDDDSEDSNEILPKITDFPENEDLEVKTLKPKKKKHKHSKSELQDTFNEDNQYLKLGNDVELEQVIKSPKKKKLKIANDITEVTEQPLKAKKSKEKKKDVAEENIHTQVTNEENFVQIGQVKIPNKALKPSVPKWMSNPSIFGTNLHSQQVSISDVGYLDENTKKNLKSSNINHLFPVQVAVIPWLTERMQSHLRCLYRPSDLCVSAPTGSGKTLAFVLPIIQALKDRVVCAIRALVVLPGSELAFQVHSVFKAYTAGTNLKVAVLTGKKSFQVEKMALVKTGMGEPYCCADIVVTTPGRILDHISMTKGFSLEHLQYLVIDEADRMMQDIQKGWLKRIEEAIYKNSNLSSCACSSLIGKRMPYVPMTVCQTMYVNEPLQKLLFSATLFHDPEKLHALSLYKPKLFTAKLQPNDTMGKCTIPEDLDVLSVVCNLGTKPMALCHLIKERKYKKVLCFTASVERAQRLHLILSQMGVLHSREISSNNTPIQRKITLEQFAQGKVDVIVCSDMVARGMDFQGVDCVVSYDVPPFVEGFVHRIGRTARAGTRGTAVTLLDKDEVQAFTKLMKTGEISMPTETFIEDNDLEQYLEAFKSALTVADSKIRKMKYERTKSKKWRGQGKQKLSNGSKPSKKSTVKTKPLA